VLAVPRTVGVRVPGVRRTVGVRVDGTRGLGVRVRVRVAEPGDPFGCSVGVGDRPGPGVESDDPDELPHPDADPSTAIPITA
jgi:hypothetical protein